MRGFEVLTLLHPLSCLLSLALLTQAICMDCSISWLDSRADETRERGDSKRQQHTALQDNDATARIQTEQFPPSLRFLSTFLPFSTSHTSLSDEPVMLGDRLIHLSFCLSV